MALAASPGGDDALDLRCRQRCGRAPPPRARAQCQIPEAAGTGHRRVLRHAASHCHLTFDPQPSQREDI